MKSTGLAYAALTADFERWLDETVRAKSRYLPLVLDQPPTVERLPDLPGPIRRTCSYCRTIHDTDKARCPECGAPSRGVMS